MFHFISTVLAQESEAAVSDTTVAALGGIFMLIWAVVMLLALASLIVWIWALVDCLRRQFPGNEKTTWIIVLIATFVLGLGLIGAIIYLLAGRLKGTLPASEKK